MDSFDAWFGPMPDWQQVARVGLKLLLALIAGALIGVQRERSGKPAGLRTHMLVALGTTVFVVSGIEFGMGDDALSRIIQGLATGIGFLGAGTILKLTDEQEIRGLTTAASIWMTAGLAVAIGLGQIVLTLVGVILTLAVLAGFLRVEDRLNRRGRRGRSSNSVSEPEPADSKAAPSPALAHERGRE